MAKNNQNNNEPTAEDIAAQALSNESQANQEPAASEEKPEAAAAAETAEAAEEVAEENKLEVFTVMKEFTADRKYRVSQKFSSEKAELVTSLKTNRFIK